MTTGLYQDGEDYYYVIGLSEDIHHFFIGFLDDMNAGVVSVALISKNIDDSGSSSGGERTITFDDNGGETTKDGDTVDTTNHPEDRPKVKVDSETGEVTLTLPDGYDMTKDGYTLVGWNTKADGSGTPYNINQPLLSEQVQALFGSSTEVTLYAQWYKPDDSDKPVIPEDPPEEDEDPATDTREANSIYDAMKGDYSVTPHTKGLEETKTYNTWMAIYKK